MVVKQQNIFNKLQLTHRFNIGDLVVYKEGKYPKYDIGYISEIHETKNSNEESELIITWMFDKNWKGEQHIYSASETITSMRKWAAADYLAVKE